MDNLGNLGGTGWKSQSSILGSKLQTPGLRQLSYCHDVAEENEGFDECETQWVDTNLWNLNPTLSRSKLEPVGVIWTPKVCEMSAESFNALYLGHGSTPVEVQVGVLFQIPCFGGLQLRCLQLPAAC